MDRIYVFIVRNDVWIYILSSLALVWYLTEYWRSRRILKSAIFGLEKEKGSRLRNRAIILAILLIAVISLVTYVNLIIAPTLPPDLLRPPTPTPNIFATPLSPPTTVVTDETATLVIAPTVTLAGTGNAVNSQTREPVQDEALTATPGTAIVTGDCSPQVTITSPPDGTTVQNTVTIFGTATGENFGSYALEYLDPTSGGEWQIISEVAAQPIVDSILGTVDFQAQSPGTYYLRLLVNDRTNVEIGQCVIALVVGEAP